jgi:hypothetical protein
MAIGARPSFADVVARHPNPDKAELTRALSALRPPPRPPLPGSGEPDEHLTRTERAWRMKRIYIAGIARLPLSKLKSNLAAARIFLSQIFNYSYVGAFTVEFLVAATYAPRFRDSMAQLGFRVLDNYDPLTPPDDKSPPAEVVAKLRERLFSRLEREGGQPARSAAFFTEWRKEIEASVTAPPAPAAPPLIPTHTARSRPSSPSPSPSRSPSCSPSPSDIAPKPGNVPTAALLVDVAASTHSASMSGMEADAQ